MRIQYKENIKQHLFETKIKLILRYVSKGHS